MLQQTRVAVVIDRYRSFLRRFPSVRALALAPEESVLAEWSGLGYYHRARNLHDAARVIVQDHSGKFPRSLDGLLALPGIGRYTAAAIASIAFGEPSAVVDGNVERVLRRLLKRELSGERLWSAAQAFLDPQRSGDFNQAMMELGATVCLTAQPRCGDCPIRQFCRTQGGEWKRTNKPRQQKRGISYVLATRGDSVLLTRRPTNHSLMPGMWELPEFIGSRNCTDQILFSLRHSITVTNYKVHVLSCSVAGAPGQWLNISQLGDIPLTGLARKILRRSGII